jgi:hypothetical protein
MVTRPLVGGVSPTMTRMVVVLPAPFGPRNPVTVPGWQTKLTLSTAVKSPYFLVSPSTLIMRQACRVATGPRIGPGAGNRLTKVGGGRRPGQPAPRLRSA